MRVLFALALAALLPAASFAETPANRWGIPADYEMWPHQQKFPCEARGKNWLTSFYGKSESGMISVVSVLEAEEKPVFLIYAQGSQEKADLWMEHLPSPSGWVHIVPSGNKNDDAPLIQQIQRIMGIETPFQAAFVFEVVGKCQDPSSLGNFVDMISGQK